MLREVGPGLFVGGRLSPGLFYLNQLCAIIDLFGSSRSPPTEAAERVYDNCPVVLDRQMMDGNAIPEATLETAYRLYDGRFPLLVHCQAGLSRSASVAYALLRTRGLLSPARARSRVDAGFPDFPRRETLRSAESWAKRKLA